MKTKSPHGDVQFFTMGDARYFLGVVALVNSLRIVGHDERVTFLDLGLTLEQRAILGSECEIVDIDRSPDVHPFTFQPYPAVLNPSGFCVIIDSDVIITQRLDPLIAAVRAGNIAGYPDSGERCHPEWEKVFDLGSRLQPGWPYLNSGLIAFDGCRHRQFLERWWELCQDIDVVEHLPDTEPTKFADQDALNALLMSEYAGDQLVPSLSNVALGAAALASTHVDDADLLRCANDDGPVVALHSLSQPKPWMPEARYMLRQDAYVTCLRRCLSGRQLAIVLPSEMIPRWLRSGKHHALEAWILQRMYRARRLVYNARLRLPGPLAPDTRPPTPQPGHASSDI